ncbi:butyrate kinase [Helicovermis profundi]|uniref:Probable butyrate kinase n=1 Tax=Helicovermis profundi TaxID=3065157 RepID=A0AAU9EA82_9FIRM|nr:butyrate kinase [Clostridia bacterium S502]
MSKGYVLVINPGSTSTKVALFKNNENIIQENLSHSSEELAKYDRIADQFTYRKDIIVKWLNDNGYKVEELIAVVGRGGLLSPIPSGVYTVTDKMIEDLQVGVQGEHASNLGGLIARSIADTVNISSYIVDPVSVDEFDDIARVSGMPEIKRKSLLHALNVKAIAYSVANDMKKDVEDLNLVIAHLGGGISVVPLRKGKMVDANNANEMGPFSPERVGGLPVGDIAKMCFSGKYTFKELKQKLRGKGGLVAYLGTNDAREVLKMIENGDKNAKLIFEAMAYQIAKEIGSMATVINGKVDAVVLTGGVAYSKYLTDYITDMVGFIAPVIVKPGEDEMKALNEGVLRIINNVDIVKIYENEVK